MERIIYTIVFGFSLGVFTCYFFSNINDNVCMHNENDGAQQKNISTDGDMFFSNMQKDVDDGNSMLLMPSPLLEEFIEDGDLQDV